MNLGPNNGFVIYRHPLSEDILIRKGDWRQYKNQEKNNVHRSP